MNNLERLHKGGFNHISQRWQPDGSVIITLVDRKANKRYKFRVRDLYGPDEQEVNIDTGEPIT